jgi:zinc and cadmium transporter
MDLIYILIATLCGGLLCVLLAATLSLTVLGRWAPRLVSFSVGILLAVALLDLLPEALRRLSPFSVCATLLLGIGLFFLLEKLALWRHDHATAGRAAAPAATGLMILVGDAVHNFVDGILIAVAFLQDTALGISTAIAIIAHEIPQEVGDFMILLSSGYSRLRALILNALASLTAVAGGLVGWAALKNVDEVIPYALTIASASFIYVAIADLIPALQQHRRPLDFAMQFSLLGSGVAVVLFAIA